MVRVQRILVPDTQERGWVLFDAEHLPLIAPNQYLSYLHHLGRSPNTVRAYAHHLQAFSKFLDEENRDWTTLSLTELAKFVTWLRRVGSASSKSRSDTTINTILAAVGSFYEYQDRLGAETNISRSRRFGAKIPYKPFLHHLSRNRPLTKQRHLRFDCKSATINNELKYACWKKFSDGDWRSTQEVGRVRRMVKWLNSLDPLPASLMIRPFAKWRAQYTTYLKLFELRSLPH